MSGAISKREQQTLLVGGVLAAVILYIYGAYVIAPLVRENKKLRDQVVSSKERLHLLKVATANAGALQEQQQQLEETVKALREVLPSDQEVPAVIERLSDLASQAGVKIQTIFPQRPGEGDAAAAPPPADAAPAPPVYYKDVMIQIEAVAGFHQLGSFLSLIESGKEPMEVASLKIQGDARGTKRPQIRLVIRSYFSTVQAASAAGGNPA